MPHAALDVVIRLVVVLSMLFSQLTPLAALAKPLADNPVADFTATPTSGDIPLTVAFSNNSTAATLYEWDFGDGATSSEANPDHSYSQSGVYSVSLQAGDGVVTDTLTLTGYIHRQRTARAGRCLQRRARYGRRPVDRRFQQ